MSLQSSRGWLREQFLEGKIWDTLETFSDILEHKGKPKKPKEPSVIETEGHEVKR